MKRKYHLLILLLFLILAIGLAGCSNSDSSTNPEPKQNSNSNDNNNNNSDPEPAEEDPDPVTIRIRVQGIFSDPENFQKYYVEPLAEVYPHITLEAVEGDTTTLGDQILTKSVPDIYAGWNGTLPELLEMEIVADIMPYVELTGSDLSRFVPSTIDSATIDGKLYGLPYAQQFNALYYNKEVFDLFGVEYPQDGMTWDETIELARKVTGERNGVQYKGLSPGAFFRLVNPLGSSNLVEFGTNKNLVPERSEDLATAFRTAYEIYSIPGNAPENIEDINNEGVALQEFAQGSVAMLATMNRVASFGDVNWGVAQYPSYPQAPNKYGAVDAHYHFLLTTSENPKDAFLVMDFFSSPEMQKMIASEGGQFPALNDLEVMEAFAANNEYTQDIDFSGVFKSEAAESPILHASLYNSLLLLGEKAVEMMEGKDVNTVMSELEQQVDTLILDYAGSN